MRYINIIIGIFFLIITSIASGFACTVTTTPVNFGAYDSYNNIDATGNVKITCSNEVAYTIKIDSGSNSGGNFNPRKMHILSGNNIMSYNLYLDSARSKIWGDSTSNTYFRTENSGVGIEKQFTIYGRLPRGQKIVPGPYNDTLVLTVAW